MEIVVLNSDIARLVFDYLKSQKLTKATHTFCKTSPYLKQEFSAYKQGLQTHSFYPELEEIICEYVKISRKVEQLLPKQTDALRAQLQQCKLSEKVCELLERGSQEILGSSLSSNKNDLKSSTSTVAACQNNNTGDEKEASAVASHGKRKRSFEISNNSSNDEVASDANTNKQHKPTSSRLGHYSKKRRVLQPYCFLSAKALQRYKRCYYTKALTSSIDDDFVEGEENEEESRSSFEDRDSGSEELDDNDDCGGDEIFDGEKPTKESTPRNKSNRKGQQLVSPILPEISQAILDNPEFQQKLVENINQALNKSSGSAGTSKKTLNINQTENNNLTSIGMPMAGDEITSSQLLDQMIKNILDATEKEPSFDAIIQEVVGASNKPQVQSAGIPCNIKNNNLPSLVNPPLYTVTEPPPLVPAQPVTQQQQMLQYTAPTSPTPTPAVTVTTNRNMMHLPSTIVAPRTPIVIRSAAASGAPNTSLTSATALTAQDPPTILASNSFGPLIDPNFSISKLIVLNSNDSAQKQQPENCIGNTTADNLISQLSTSGVVVDTNDEQVYFDTSTGQLTFPIFLTNDGLLTNFPFLINNEIVNQQLQTNNVGNLEGSRLEIPLIEPIMVSANQLPPNAIILGSAQKENVAENPATVEKTIKEAEIKHCNTVPPACSDTRSLYDKATPSSSGIVNTKAFKSLSTPRKRTSHVRTLTFSPRDPHSLANVGTPLSTRADAISRFQITLPKAMPEEKKTKIEESGNKTDEKENNANDKAIIKTVEILPTITNSVNAGNSDLLTAENTNVSAQETSNIPPLFVNEESSNQTIINKETLKEPLKPKALTNFTKIQTTGEENTPKRKQFRKTALRSCKRQLSKSSNDEDILEEKQEKENERTTESPPQPDERNSKDDMMQEWIRLRTSNVDLDVRLREINASTQSKQAKKINTKKRVRRKKPAAIKKKEKELAKEAEELESSNELHNDSQDLLTEEHSVKTLNGKKEEPKTEEQSNEKIGNENIPPSENLKQYLTLEEDKILTTQIEGDKMAEKSSKTDKTECPIKNATQCQVTGVVPQPPPPHFNDTLEREKRTTNIAFLLETPFKDPNLASCNPPTPGIFAPSLETPAGKLKDPHDEMQASTSFLFGSITKSELDTPVMSAITPGFRFTPFGLKEIGTPKSITGTDYSSGGGSYYKPDESEDLDRNIDKMLRNSAQKKPDTEEANDINKGEQVVEEGEIVGDPEINECNEEMDKIEIEIPVEKLKVEPIVLKRVKSLSTEAVDCIETAKIDPHYTLVSGLPEISAAEEEESSSSSSSSGSSSSSESSSSSSSSFSSSSSSSSSSNGSIKSKTVIEAAQTNKKVNINDLENLSEISSTEDEEWQKLAVTDNDENSQLVSNDGEVRYPVRSWLTPIKENITVETKSLVQTEQTQVITSGKTSSIKVTLPLKSAEKRNRQVKELEMKKERIKEKLKNDAKTITKKDKSTTSVTAAPNISAALAASRMIHAMRDKGKKPACFQTPNSTETLSGETQEDKRSIDVLTALNLSAKKHLPKTPENLQKPSLRPLAADDSAKAVSPKYIKGKSKLHISPSATNKTLQRKCLPIEARPVTRTIRKSGKKIVRTPLAFKVIHSPGKINSHSTTTTLAELAATKTLKKSKETASPFEQQPLRVSPRLMKPGKVRSKNPIESPAQKTRANTRSVKTKTAAVVKPKVGRTRSAKKKDTAPAPLEEEMQELLKDWKEESLGKGNEEDPEEKDREEKTTAAVIKPKIHLKARNAMISTKPKAIAKKEILAAKKADNKVLAEEIPPPSIPPTKQQQVVEHETKAYSSPLQAINDAEPQTTPMPPKNSTKGDGCFEDDDDDPLEDCEITTIDETDTNRFITYTYTGPDTPLSVVPQRHDFSNFQMVVAIDENEKHIWRITEGICLFSCAPKASAPPATILKKRKIRATTVTTVMSENTPTTTTASSNSKIAALKSFTTNTPAATSTPVAAQGSNSRLTAENVKASATSGGIAGSKVRTTTTTKTQPAEAGIQQQQEQEEKDSSNETPKIQIEDIESILSHLHGT